MDAKQISIIEKKYLSQKSLNAWDEIMIVDKEIIEDIVTNFNEVLIAMSVGDIDYCDKIIVKQIYLVIFPEVYGMIPESASDIQLTLMNYYYYLNKQKVLAKKDYLEMVFFFQKNQQLFFNRLMEEFYGDEEGMNKMLEDWEEIQAKDMGNYLQGEKKSTRNNSDLKNNVISVKFGKKKSE